MSMAFLVPLFLLGVAGIVVPILVHLTRRQRRNVVVFPSLMFLERIPFQEQRRRRIQHWLLLALRSLALALLALAFARPFLDRTDLSLGAASGPREIVVLLDQSYSMEIGDQFTRALEEAREIFADLGPLDRASLVVFGQGARVVTRSTGDRLRLNAALDTLSISSSSTSFGPALKVAQTVLEESELPMGEVYLLSDFQRIGWAGDEGVYLPAGAKVISIKLSEDPPDNIQVTDVDLIRQAVSGRERITPTARIARNGGVDAREIDVSLELDGQEIQTRTLTLDANGATSVTFQPFTVSQPHTRGSIRIPTDELTADDVKNFVVSPGTALSLLVIDGSGGSTDASLYLRRALEISDDGRFRLTHRRTNNVRAEDLDDTDAVIINDARIDGASAERLRNFVQAGGGLLVVLGERAGWPASAQDLLPGAAGEPQDRLQGRGGRLGHLEYGHPVFEPFSGPRSGDFTGARFFRTRNFVLSDSASVLARFDDGSVAFAEQTYGLGRVLVWTSTLDSFWNDLALQPVYLPFIHRVSEYIGGRTEALPWFMIGQVLDLADPVALESAGLVSAESAELSDGREQVALTPSGKSIDLSSDDGPRYLALDESGFYTIRPPGSDPERPFVVAVNVELEESNLTTLDPEELVAQVTSSVPNSDAASGFIQATDLQMEDQERRQALWRWVLIAAFGLLAAETLMSNWVSRRTAAATLTTT